MLLTGRILAADEALAWGLLSALHSAEELLPAANAVADRIASNDPLATQYTKRSLQAPLADHPAIDLELQAELFDSPEKERRMTDFLERRR
jgi:enoyl-CoA hydratase